MSVLLVLWHVIKHRRADAALYAANKAGRNRVEPAARSAQGPNSQVGGAAPDLAT